MAASVHDNVLVSYEVFSEERRIVLHTEFRERKPPERTRVVFAGVEAYHFAHDAFDGNNILFDLVTVPVESLLSDLRAEIEEARKFANWPWAQDLDAAPAALRAKGTQAFELSASLGLSGWVLARTAGIAHEPKPIDVPSGTSERGVYALAKDGTRTPLDATGVVVAFGDGRKLAVNLSRHPSSNGGVDLRSEYEGPAGSSVVRPAEGKRPDVYAFIVIHPAGGNWMHAAVTAHGQGDGAKLAPVPGAEATLRKSYALVRKDDEVGCDVESFLFDCGEGRVLQLDPPWGRRLGDRVSFLSGPPPTREEAERFMAGGPRVSSGLTVRFGGGNVVHLEVSRPYSSHAIQRPSAKA